MPLKVRKNDGSLEGFDRAKISGGAMKSGATAEQAEQVASQVEAWAQGAAIDGIIATTEVRAKVLEALRLVNPTAAASFEAYQKPVAQEPTQEPAAQAPEVPAEPITTQGPVEEPTIQEATTQEPTE